MEAKTLPARNSALTVLWKRSTLPVVVGELRSGEQVFYAVLPADPVEEHLAFARPEAGGEHLAVVGEDLVGDPMAAHGEGQSFAHRASGGPGHKERGDAEAGVVVEAGDDLELAPLFSFTPPMMSICQSSMERVRSQRR